MVITPYTDQTIINIVKVVFFLHYWISTKFYCLHFCQVQCRLLRASCSRKKWSGNEQWPVGKGAFQKNTTHFPRRTGFLMPFSKKAVIKRNQKSTHSYITPMGHVCSSPFPIYLIFLQQQKHTKDYTRIIKTIAQIYSIFGHDSQ